MNHGDPPYNGVPWAYQLFNLVSGDSGDAVGLASNSSEDYQHIAAISVGAYDDSVQIVADPHDPVVDFSLIPPVGNGSGSWNDGPGGLCYSTNAPNCHSWGFSINHIEVPEASSLLLLGSGLLGFAAGARRSHR